MKRFIVIYIVLGITALYVHLHTNHRGVINKPLDTFPAVVTQWTMASQTEFSAGVMSVLKPTDYLMRTYTDTAGNKVLLYVGYHDGGKGSGGIHSPKHCLPGSGWYEVSTQRGELAVAGEQLNLVRSVYQKGEGSELFIYWFQVKDKTLSEEYSLKWAEITNSLLYQRRDSAFIRISVPFTTDKAHAVKVGEQFVHDFYPIIREYLPL